MLKEKKEKRIIFRLEQVLKEKFLMICEEIQTSPASILREMVKTFVDEYKSENCQTNSVSINQDTYFLLKEEVKSLKKKVDSLERRLSRKSSDSK
ncbi:MAG: hypothetical protein EA365_14080 [Gloeocapsa sp. DLM2.Bin57]|nr:MAG: hypothetical protein EA365_14080 [Gloeocapsa sp. DLM2.Bin57]